MPIGIGSGGERRSADVIANAVHVARIATRETGEEYVNAGRSAGGRKDGKARAAAMSVERRREMAQAGATARWRNGESGSLKEADTRQLSISAGDSGRMSGPTTGPNRSARTIWTGDSPGVMRGMNSASADLIHLDPPFNSKANCAAPAGSGAAGAAFRDTWGPDGVNVARRGEIKHEHPGLYSPLQAIRPIHGDSMMSRFIHMVIRVMEIRNIESACRSSGGAPSSPAPIRRVYEMKRSLGIALSALFLSAASVTASLAQDEQPINLAHELFNSVQSASRAKVLKWLGDGGDPNIVIDSEGNTLVHHAATNLPDVLRAVVQSGGESPGETFRDCAECPELVVIPSGSYMMGSPPDEEGRYEDEGPRHEVTIARPFAVGVDEVTRGEFGQFVSATGHSTEGGCWIWTLGDDGDYEWQLRSGRSWRNPGYSQGDSDPAVCVDWEDAQAYVEWLRSKTGEEYRLLSESEWEYVARAGTNTRYSWGDDVGENRANCWNCGSRWDGERTAPVRSFESNGFGLYDLHGNVWEWVQDCWNDSYRGAPTDGRAWESGDCSHRVLRGGSWFFEPGYLRSAVRDRGTTGIRNDGLGFRIARTLTP